MNAILVVDMIYDFVYGEFGSENAQDIIENLVNLLEYFQEWDTPIFFAEDQHKQNDPEIEVWGQHAMKGEKGAETIETLKRFKEREFKKNTFNAFFKTSLDEELRDRNIDSLLLTGVSTDICIQNTAAGAFYRGYEITVLKDCTASLSEKNHEDSLEYMKNIFGAKIKDSKKIIKELEKKKKGV